MDSSTNFEPTLWGGHTLFIFKIGHTGAFRPKSAEIGQKPSFSSLGCQKHLFLGGRRNALYNTWLAGSIADAFGSNITFFKNRLFLGGSGGIFGAVKIVVFHGFHSSLSISTLIIKRKMLAPSFRALSKALNSELSIEP